MTTRITRDSPLARALAELCKVPVERIQDWAIVVQYDTGVALIHTLCCDEHARQGLALIAATPPDVTDITHEGQDN
jgi:hypothetical protein